MDNNSFILNGPYLLHPTSSHMTIAWETHSPEKMQLVYGDGEQFTHQMIPDLYHETLDSNEHSDGNCIYIATLTNLKAATEYIYQIQHSSGQTSSGTFRTLAAQPTHLKIVTLSDSHLFYTQKQFSAMVKRTDPDFIIHCGDISFGTGHQHNQYVENWFQKIPDLLKSTPIFYIPGNHDDGPFYNDFFTVPQSRHCNCDETGRNYSFDHGKTHFVLIDSNPWGLFEMNAVNSGLSTDDHTKETIRCTLDWLIQDISSEKAQEADWRILFLHHPYTDEFNNKYIVPIAEKYNINLVIGGHLHYYVKTVSSNPQIGAKTVYISQGSAQDENAELNQGTSECRLLTEFPEVLSMGKSNYGILNITSDQLSYESFGFTKTSPEGTLVDHVILVHDKPEISISDIKIKRLDNIGHIEITGKATNMGRGLSVVTLDLFDNNQEHSINLFGQLGKERILALNSNESQEFSTIYQAIQPGQHEIRVEDIAEHIIVFEPEQLTFAHMKLHLTRPEGANVLSVSIEATNNLDREIFIPVHLYMNQRIVETQNLFFRGHEKKSIQFYYKVLRGGHYQVSIADQIPQEITIQGAIRVVPRVKDISGHGNHGLLHGTPKVITEPNQVVVHLEQYGDYIEIPHSSTLCVENAFTGMVWANIDRLAKDHEMSHNPLMVKGKSVGWGATYLLRMVIERNGGLKWGTCHDITEYSWQGGTADLNAWTQYTLAFAKDSGGNSYCNGKQVAYTTGIDPDSILRNWEDSPLFIGYSYIGHVIEELNRPKYFTHLSGKISQARFYKGKISSTENQFIYQNPYELGPQSDQLAVWLDFHDILTVGSHTTEWRHPAVFKPAYKTEKKHWEFKQLKTVSNLPLQASLKATIEVSDDKESIKGHQEIVIKHGTNYINLIKLPKAQYIRIISYFSAEVGAEGTFIPELQEYEITAFNETDFTDMIWATHDDWAKGTFTGAIGFEPIDRLKDFPTYTDVIHG